MPFAVIAVTLLLLASVAAAVAAEQARVNSGIDSTMDSATGLERALDDVQSYVNQELGVIILDISKNDSLGGLDERADAFKERAYSWIDDRFPMGYGEVTVKLNGRTLDLTAESMEISTSDVIGAFVPSYLHGTGSIDVTAVSETGRSSRQLTISTDGSYALPLVAEQGYNAPTLGGIPVRNLQDVASELTTGQKDDTA